MKLARVLLLFVALFVVLWLIVRPGEAPPVAQPVGTPGDARPARAEEVLHEAEQLRDAQEIPCRPGDPLCAPAAPRE